MKQKPWSGVGFRWQRRHRLHAWLTIIVALSMVSVTACGGGSSDTPGGADYSSGDDHLGIVAFAVSKPIFDATVPLFRARADGRNVGFAESFGPSGDQSRKVARGVPADIATMSVESDITRLVAKGLVDRNWKSQFPHNSVAFTSVITFVVRKGNPRGIYTWRDLLKPGVEVISPNPASSGSAKWNLLAPYAAASDGGKNPDAGLDFVRSLVKDHIRTVPKSGREATTAFQSGQGDVLISYENEALMLARANATAPAPEQVEYLIPPQSFLIEMPTVVLSNSPHRSAAQAYTRFLFTDQAQLAVARAGFRPVMAGPVETTRSRFPEPSKRLWTIDDLARALNNHHHVDNFGGSASTSWGVVDNALFGDQGAITTIYNQIQR